MPLPSCRRFLFSCLSLGILLLAAAGLRLSCSAGELWLDEIWTWEIAGKLTWVGGLFYQLREENNHYLNTLVVWILREQTRDAGFYYRLPAVLCGVATVGLAWRIGRNNIEGDDRRRVYSKSATEEVGSLASYGLARTDIRWDGQLLYTTLVATSYLLVHYSSEARGYAYAVFFAALSFDRLSQLESDRQSDGNTGVTHIPWWAGWQFSLACCGGFLSQPIFLTCFGAMAGWIYFRVRRSVRPDSHWPILIRYFAVPALFFVLLYVVDLRHAVNGGGDVYPLWQVIVETLSLTAGGPFQGGCAVVVAGLVIGVFIHGLCVMARKGDDRWLFHLLVVVVMPLGLLVVLRRAEVYPRYFLIAVFFLLQAGSIGLLDLCHRNRIFKVLVLCCLVGVLWGNGQHLRELSGMGRNGYLPVLESLASRESGPEIVLRSDHDFRHPLMFKYYLPLAQMRGKSWRYINHVDVPEDGTPWLLTHSLEVGWHPEPMRIVRGVSYQLREFRAYPGLSGWGLALYQRQSASSSEPNASKPTDTKAEAGM